MNDTLTQLVTTHVNNLVEVINAEVRKNLAEELAQVLGGTSAKLAQPKVKKERVRKPCIAKGCRNLSKGPRFKFLCDDHKKASKASVEAWKRGEAAPVSAAKTKKKPAAQAAGANGTPSKSNLKPAKKRPATVQGAAKKAACEKKIAKPVPRDEDEDEHEPIGIQEGDTALVA